MDERSEIRPEIWHPDRVERVLSGRRPTVLSRQVAPRRAAVAALLRMERGGAEVLLMRRAVREGDRWSGQCSFPGGMEESTDPTLPATAERETLEELGFSLRDSARPIGALDDIRAIAKGKLLPMAISPFVYRLTGPIELTLNHEAESAFWLPLHRVAAGELDDTMTYKMGPVPMRFGCWRFEGYTVWGLTYRMIQDLLRIVSATP